MTVVYISQIPEACGKDKHKIEHDAAIKRLMAGANELFSTNIDENEIIKTQYGKPFLKDHPGIYFSISHCTGYAACAVSDTETGLDIERFRNVNEKIYPKVFTPAEQDFLNNYKNDCKKHREMFCRLWTLKESRLKQNGMGFYGNPAGFEFTLEFSERGTSVKCSDRSVNFYQEMISHDCVLSVCAENLDEITLRIM